MDAAHRACLAPAAVDELAAPDAVRLDVHVKCRAVAHDSLLAEGLDFQKAAAALSAALAYQDARQPQAALQRVVYSREPRRLAERLWLRVVNQELQDESVSARQAQRASRRLEKPLVLALAP